MNKETIIQKIEAAFLELANTVNAMPSDVFFQKERAEKWSAAEEVQHLSLTYMPFNKLMGRPAILIRRWGKSNRPSRDPETFQADYKQAREGAAWMTFPPFVPMHENESSDYIALHASSNQVKIQEFQDLSGGDLTSLREEVPLKKTTGKGDVLAEFQKQSALLLEAAEKLTEEQLDACRLPLPYIGLITVREGLYFTLSHTNHHLGSINMLSIPGMATAGG